MPAPWKPRSPAGSAVSRPCSASAPRCMPATRPASPCATGSASTPTRTSSRRRSSAPTASSAATSTASRPRRWTCATGPPSPRSSPTRREDRLEIGAPLTGRARGQRSIDIARPLRDAAGGFAGIIMVAVDSGSFSRLYRRLDLQGGSVGLVGLRRHPPRPGPGARQPARPAAARRHHRHYPRRPPTRRIGATAAWSTGSTASSSIAGCRATRWSSRSAPMPMPPWPRRGRNGVELLAIGGVLTLLILGICLGVAQVRRRDRRSRAQLEAVVAHVGQGIMMIDPNRRLAVVNRRATEMLGLPPGLAVPGRPIEAIVAWQEQAGEFGGGPAPHYPCRQLRRAGPAAGGDAADPAGRHRARDPHRPCGGWQPCADLHRRHRGAPQRRRHRRCARPGAGGRGGAGRGAGERAAWGDAGRARRPHPALQPGGHRPGRVPPDARPARHPDRRADRAPGRRRRDRRRSPADPPRPGWRCGPMPWTGGPTGGSPMAG